MRKLIPLLLLCTCLAACTEPKTPPIPQPIPQPTPYDTALRDGSVAFIHGGLLVEPIQRHTDSPLTHAAIVLYQNGQPWVYEAVPPRVRKLPWAEYVTLMDSHRSQPIWQKRDYDWFVIQPRRRFSAAQLAAMRAYAESQLGRPYMLRGWWKDREVRGIFCSQLVGNAIEKSGLIQSANYHESPGSLYQKLEPYYEPIEEKQP